TCSSYFFFYKHCVHHRDLHSFPTRRSSDLYDIDGSSAGALRDQIRRLGPKDESGTSHDALTVWSLEWGYATAHRGDSCALRDVRVTLNVSVTLPRWTPPATATARPKDSWRTYLRNVRLHESGHRTIAERNARE